MDRCLFQKDGFSLGEVLFSIALLSIALVVLIGVMIAGYEGITKGNSYMEATNIAQSRMEKIIYAVNEDFYALDDPDHELMQDDDIGNYNLHVTLTDNTAYNNPYKKVVVNVSSVEELGRKKGVEVNLETIFINKQ